MSPFVVNFLVFLVLVGLSLGENGDGLEEHLVAFHCGRPAMHWTSQGWTTDNTTDCLTEANDILTYCKKMYPDMNVRNFVKLDRKVTVGNWCDFAGENCNQEYKVKAFQCLVDESVENESSPTGDCQTSQIVSATECRTLEEWETKAMRSCTERGMIGERFLTLEQCSVERYRGIQFVCCSGQVSVETVNSWPAVVGKTESLTPTVTDVSDSDVESRPETEHKHYMRVLAGLRRHHDSELAKIMDAWDDAHREVEKMRVKDPVMAEKLEKKITARFQKTVNALEDKEEEEKKMAESLHDQRVQKELNERKREAMEVYLAVLSKKEEATMQNVFRVLRHYVRMEQKDRMHVLNHYQHLKEVDSAAAESSRALMAEHLRTIQMRVDRALQMLNRVPEHKAEIRRKIEDVLDEYQGFDELENSIIRNTNSAASKDAKQSEKQKKEQKEEDFEAKETENEKDAAVAGVEEGDEVETAQADEIDRLVKPEAVELEESDVDVLEPAVRPSHVDTNKLLLNEQQSLKQKRDVSYNFGPLVGIVVVTVFLVTISVLGIVVWRRHVEVESRRQSRTKENARLLASSDQVHVANMQANGYENPTYKYFEARAII